MDLSSKTRFNTWYWIGAFFILMVFQSIFTTVTQVVEIPYMRLVSMEDGPGRGLRLLIGRNAAGVQFEVAVDRGFDISSLSVNGINIGWHSPTQMPFPSTNPDSEEGWGFLRNFDGFMVTCGLDHYSRPREADVAHYNHPHLIAKAMPLHGRISTEKARLLAYGVDPDTGNVFCEGIVRQASVFGETLELRRKINLAGFGAELTIDDTVTNRGFRPTRHAVLYHLNYGYPFLDGDLEISGLPARLLTHMRSDPPVPGDDYGEQVDLADSAEMPEGEPVVLRNPKLDVSVGLTFSRSNLTKLAVWRAYQSGIFALGIEPRTEAAEDRPFLQPGENCRHSLQLALTRPNVHGGAFLS